MAVVDDQQYAYFSVSDGFDPAEITARVEVLPTECWRRGETCPRRHRERKFSRWSATSTASTLGCTSSGRSPRAWPGTRSPWTSTSTGCTRTAARTRSEGIRIPLHPGQAPP